MLPKDVEEFTEKLRAGRYDGARKRPAAPTWHPHRPVASRFDSAIAELLLPGLSAPGAREKLAGLERDARAARKEQQRQWQESAVEASHGAQRELDARTRQRWHEVTLLADLPPDSGSPTIILLRQPYLIFPYNIILDSSGMADLSSSAKFSVVINWDSNFSGEVRFFYYWENPYINAALVNIDALASWNGHNSITVNGGVWPDNENNSWNYASLEISSIWEDAVFVGDSWEIFGADIKNHDLYDNDAVLSSDTHSFVDLHVNNILIPPFRAVIFAVTENVGGIINGIGESRFDYRSGAFQFGSPFAWVTVVALVPPYQTPG